MTQAGPHSAAHDPDRDRRYAAQPVSMPASTVGQVFYTRACIVTWWSFTEATGAATASLRIFDGADATGQELTTIDLLANESRSDDTGAHGLFLTRGVFVQVLSGSVRGVIGLVPA